MTLTSLFSETHDYNRLAMHNNPLMGEGYNLPAFITMSIMQSMVASPKVCLGSVRFAHEKWRLGRADDGYAGPIAASPKSSLDSVQAALPAGALAVASMIGTGIEKA